MKVIFLVLLLSACASNHQANIKDATQRVEPAVQQQPVQQPAVPPAVRQPRAVTTQPVKSEQSNSPKVEQSSPPPQKKNEHNIEED